MPTVFIAFANDRVNEQRYLRNLPEEARRIQDSLEPARRSKLCQIVCRQNCSSEELISVVQAPDYCNDIAVFHFGGHAGTDRIMLESMGGAPKLAHATGLAKLLGQLPELRLVFLNGCSTQEQVRALHDAGVPVVISTNTKVHDDVATKFASFFYTALAAGMSIAIAYRTAEAATRMVYGDDSRDYSEGEAGNGFPWGLYPRSGSSGEPDPTDWRLDTDDPLYPLPCLPKIDQIDLPPAPFRHIQRFERQHSAIFFGRSRQIRELYDRITDPEHAPVILLHGQAGVGKSSLLEAGVLPRLEANYRTLYVRRSQERGLLGDLIAALCSVCTSPPGSPLTKNVHTLWRCAESNADQPVNLIIDQTEEVFTRPSAKCPRELADFVAALAVLFNTAGWRPRGKLIIGLRKEWLSDIEAELILGRIPISKTYLDSLDRRGVIEAVRGPCGLEGSQLRLKYNLSVAEGLPELIATEFGNDPESPLAPTLQILLSQMWERVKADPRPNFNLDLYRLVKKRVFLREFLADQLDAMHKWRRQDDIVKSGFALSVLAAHTTPQATSEQRTLEELRKEFPLGEKHLGPMLEKFKELYLLVDPPPKALDFNIPSTTVMDKSSTRLAHDTLAPFVREQFDKSILPGQRARRILETRVVEWRNGRKGSTLDDGTLRIVEAGRFGMRDWDEDEQRLVDASRASCKKARIARFVLRGAGIVAIVLIALGGVIAYYLYNVANAQAERSNRAREVVLSFLPAINLYASRDKVTIVPLLDKVADRARALPDKPQPEAVVKADVLSNIGRAYDSVNDLILKLSDQDVDPEVAKKAVAALDQASQLYGDNEPEKLALTLNWLGWAELRAKSVVAAADAMKRAYELRLRMLGPQAKLTLNAKSDWARVLWETDRDAGEKVFLDVILESQGKPTDTANRESLYREISERVDDLETTSNSPLRELVIVGTVAYVRDPNGVSSKLDPSRVPLVVAQFGDMWAGAKGKTGAAAILIEVALRIATLPNTPNSLPTDHPDVEKIRKLYNNYSKVK